MKKEVLSKRFFYNRIKEQHKTMEDISKELNVSVATVKLYIRKSYCRKAWAERLIIVAIDNAKKQDMAKQAQNVTVVSNTQLKEHDVKPVLVDTSMILSYPEALQSMKVDKNSKLLVPSFCLNTAKKLMELTPEKVRCTGEEIEKLDLHEVSLVYLPRLDIVPFGTKSCSILFVKYLVQLRTTTPEITAVTCSREIKELAMLNGIKL